MGVMFTGHTATIRHNNIEVDLGLRATTGRLNTHIFRLNLIETEPQLSSFHLRPAMPTHQLRLPRYLFALLPSIPIVHFVLHVCCQPLGRAETNNQNQTKTKQIVRNRLACISCMRSVKHCLLDFIISIHHVSSVLPSYGPPT